jgi:orotate phosphoribosyltransferase
VNGLPEELLNLLAARKGHFKLESGHHGNLWLDLDLLFLQPSRVRPFAIELANKFSKYNLAAVCGPLVGGALLAQTIAVELELEFYYTERFVLPQPEALYPVAYRLPDTLRQSVQGKNMAIVDDAINAGSAVRATLAELRSYGARPVAIGALLVLGSAAPDFFAGQNIPVESIASLASKLWMPAECPLCASQILLEDIAAAR